jgi:large subunit ribosomal protein L4
MYRAALQSILSELARQNRLVIVEAIDLAQPKTKLLQQKLSALNLSSVLIVSDEISENLYLSSRNLPHVEVRDVNGADPVSLVRFEKVLITLPAVKKFEEVLA